MSSDLSKLADKFAKYTERDGEEFEDLEPELDLDPDKDIRSIFDLFSDEDEGKGKPILKSSPPAESIAGKSVEELEALKAKINEALKSKEASNLNNLLKVAEKLSNKLGQVMQTISPDIGQLLSRVNQVDAKKQYGRTVSGQPVQGQLKAALTALYNQRPTPVMIGMALDELPAYSESGGATVGLSDTAVEQVKILLK